jgi:hypothetical protein
VEGTGRFWVDNLPLVSGANQVTLTVTDAAGNTTNLTLNVQQSTVTLTIASLADPNQLWQPAVNLTGTISGSGYAVSVNGVAATMSGTTWSAANVPVTAGGVACFTVAATKDGQTHANDKSSPEKPDTVGIIVWHDEQTMHEYDYNETQDWWYDPYIAGGPWDCSFIDESTSVSDLNQHWDYDDGGHAHSIYTFDNTQISEGLDPITDEAKWYTTISPQFKREGDHQFSPGDHVPYDYQSSTYTTVTGDPPYLNQLGCEVCNVQNKYSTSTWDDSWWRQEDHQHTYTRTARTVLALCSGGRAIPGQKILHQISGWVKYVPGPYYEGQRPPYYPIYQYHPTWFSALPTVPSTSVNLLGDTLHDPGGSLYLVTYAGRVLGGATLV